MKRSFLLFLILLTGMISGCDSLLQNESESADHSKMLRVEDFDSLSVNLRFGERVIFPEQNLDIRFKDVLSDSRCPEDVVCIWQGNAELVMLLNDQHNSLNTTLNPTVVTAGHYSIKIAELHPPAHSEKPIHKKEYQVLLSIEKIK